eukprot:jgi/Chlat1/3820/Chrsp26S03972
MRDSTASQDKSAHHAVVSHGISSSQSAIDALPPDAVRLVLLRLNRFSDVANAAAVCHAWRDLIYSDQEILTGFKVCRRVLVTCSCTQPLRVPKHAPGAVPRVLQCAAEMGNLSALACVAHELEAHGEHRAAMELWRKAARRGHQEAMYRLGDGLYRGYGQGDEALVWLLKAVRYSAEDADKSTHANAACIEDAVSVLQLLLGYIYHDGEGTRSDNSEAVRWFKFAVSLGNREAGRMLGMLWNTGQY